MARKRNSNLNFKKGNTFLDSILVLIVLFVFAIATISGMYLLDDVNSDIIADTDSAQETKDSIGTTYNQFQSVFDAGFIIIFVLFWLFVIIASFMIDSNPIFFIVAILLLGFVIYIGAALANYYVEFSEEAEMVAISDLFPMTNFVMNNLVIFVLIIGFSIIIALYAKNRAG